MMTDPHLKHPSGHTIDMDRLIAFEKGLNSIHPARSHIPAQILDYGEISTVFVIEGMESLAFKRLSIFENEAEIDAYAAAYDRYCNLLEEAVGITLVPHGYVEVFRADDRPIFYIVQQKMEAGSVGHRAIQGMPQEKVIDLVERLFNELLKLWTYNLEHEGTKIALDAQISNWVIEDNRLLYMDTSTPLFRLEGEEQLNPELFLRPAPSFLRWILRLFFLQDVVGRYYNRRDVVIDVIANFYKEGRAEMVATLVETANAFFATYAPDVEPVTVKDVESYYKEDAFIWSLYLGFRRFDRTLHRLTGRSYPYLLPGKIKR